MRRGTRRRTGTARGSEADIATAWWSWARPLGGAAILGAVTVQLGTDAFADAVRAVDGVALAGGTVVAAVATAAGAWRWRVVARQLGVELDLSSALAACYRAQFLNATLPGGVLGDVHRGVRHGRAVDDVGGGLRGVVWERTCGQLVLVALTVVALLAGGPFGSLPLGVGAVAVALLAVLLLGVARLARRRRPGALTRMSQVAAADARGLLAPSAALSIIGASIVALAAHVATFAIAARTVGVRMPVSDFVPLTLLVLLVAAVPLNLAGWGPREGAAAWAFGAAGASSSQGLAVAVAYGVIVVVATLPGAVLLLVGRSRGASATPVGPREVVVHD
ncbi:lysylphosphatidylglycerol synthase domain-containing protein [Knoellia sp. CPCC 206435]|uniref:lysylphosphatidylglycerol synthase domain-containing protein n=1 Tax=Knoellia terrae TaxID=3404797 RepID=UPI003B42DBCF